MNKIIVLLASIAALSLNSCITTTAPDGTVTKTPDRELIRYGTDVFAPVIIRATK